MLAPLYDNDVVAGCTFDAAWATFTNKQYNGQGWEILEAVHETAPSGGCSGWYLILRLPRQ